MKILGFDKEKYNKEKLEKLNDNYLEVLACEDENVIMLEDIKDFQDYLNSIINHSDSYWWYFININ